MTDAVYLRLRHRDAWSSASAEPLAAAAGFESLRGHEYCLLTTFRRSGEPVPTPVWFGLAAGKARTGAALDNPVLRTEGRVTLVDGLLAVAVLASLVLNAAAGCWWAYPVAGYVLLAYAAHEVYAIFIAHDGPGQAAGPPRNRTRGLEV